MDNKAILYIVPTPIGNLEDMTFRAVKTLQSVDVIACEDTRNTGFLLKHYEIGFKKLVSYYDQNEAQRTLELIDMLNSGINVALVSDAGTPLISDPGFRLIKAAAENDIEIISLPGATAGITALAASGIATDSFIFLGFPPHKKGRKTFVEKIAESIYTTIIYESPNRLIKFLKELADADLPDRNVCVAREISKIHEEYIRGPIQIVLELLEKRTKIKGEIVIIIEGKK